MGKQLVRIDRRGRAFAAFPRFVIIYIAVLILIGVAEYLVFKAIPTHNPLRRWAAGPFVVVLVLYFVLLFRAIGRWKRAYIAELRRRGLRRGQVIPPAHRDD